MHTFNIILGSFGLTAAFVGAYAFADAAKHDRFGLAVLNLLLVWCNIAFAAYRFGA